MSPAGKHIVLDLYNCNYDIISDQDLMQAFITETLAGNSLNVQSMHRQKLEENKDFSLVAFFENGHIIAHIMPDKGFAAVDIFSSLDNAVLDKIAIKIKQGLRSEKTKITYLRRGDFGSLSDMKPTINKNIKTWRRVRNTSAKVWKIIVNRHQENRGGFPD